MFFGSHIPANILNYLFIILIKIVQIHVIIPFLVHDFYLTYWSLHIVAQVSGAVEVAVGDGFHDVVVEDVGGAFEVGDGAGDF